MAQLKYDGQLPEHYEETQGEVLMRDMKVKPVFTTGDHPNDRVNKYYDYSKASTEKLIDINVKLEKRKSLKQYTGKSRAASGVPSSK